MNVVLHNIDQYRQELHDSKSYNQQSLQWEGQPTPLVWGHCCSGIKTSTDQMCNC